MVNATRHKLLLSSKHKGRAIVKKNKNFNFMGHPVYWFELGNYDQAVDVEISQNYPDGQLIRIADTNHGFDCAKGQYHNQNEVVTWRHHMGGNQWFAINDDLTISPTLAPNMVWGLRKSDNRLVLVPKGDENQLIFDGLPQAFSNKKVMKLAPSNFTGKAVVATHKRNHGHGMELHVTFGDSNDPNAISIFAEGDHIMNAAIPYNTLDGWDHKKRPEGCVFFTKHSDYPHQRFTVNEDGTIGLNIDPKYVLGTNDR